MKQEDKKTGFKGIKSSSFLFYGLCHFWALNRMRLRWQNGEHEVVKTLGGFKRLFELGAFGLHWHVFHRVAKSCGVRRHDLCFI